MPFTKFYALELIFPFGKAIPMLDSRPVQISAMTVLFIPLPVPCQLRPLRGPVRSRAVRRIAKLVFVFIN